jgi:hypothetical protein
LRRFPTLLTAEDAEGADDSLRTDLLFKNGIRPQRELSAFCALSG